MISKLFKKNKDDPKLKNDLEDLFSRPIKAIEVEPEPEEIPYEASKPLEQEGDEELSAVQIKERNERTIFVGNVDIDLEKKHLIKHFKSHGKIEKVWFRSIPTDKGKLTNRAAVILKKYAQGASGKNAYILFSTKQEAEKALVLNGSVIKLNHLRVDMAIAKPHDYTKTIFIGNLPFTTTEEELRVFFADCGAIDNVRIVRDPATHVGKGIAYIAFKDANAFKAGLKKNNTEFKERELRIKKAAPAQRVEKKQMRKEKSVPMSNAERRIARKQKKEERDDYIKDEDMKGLLENSEIKEPNVEDLNLENEIKSSPAILRKKIRKAHRKTGDDKLQIHLKETQRTKDKQKKELFNGINERKKRKEQLKKKALLNKKQFARQRQPLMKSK